MLILAIDTATPRVSAAVSDGHRALGEATEHGPTRHGELLAPLVNAALEQAGTTPQQLGAIAVGTGPGPYTGLRVGLVFAEVMASAVGVPVWGACTLDVVAAEVAASQMAPERFAVATDARRKEVYWALYEHGRRTQGPAVGKPAGVAHEVLGVPAGPFEAQGQPDQIPCFGAGAVLYPVLRRRDQDPEAWPLYPSMGVLASLVSQRIAGGEAPEPPHPLYLRRPDAETNWQRKPVLPGAAR